MMEASFVLALSALLHHVPNTDKEKDTRMLPTSHVAAAGWTRLEGSLWHFFELRLPLCVCVCVCVCFHAMYSLAPQRHQHHPLHN